LDEEKIRTLARKYALINAITHDGRGSPSSVIGRLLGERRDLASRARDIAKIAEEVVAKVNCLSEEQQRQALENEFPNAKSEEEKRSIEKSQKGEESKGKLPELPGAVRGQVITRFPPEPNGYMHIGHAKAALLGREYATIYNGQFIVRFDDTNPAAERLEFYSAFLESLDWLGIKPDRVKNASDDMEKFYDLAESLIRRGGAYACACTRDEMKSLRLLGKECPHRENSVDKNLELWKDMVSGKARKNEIVLRYKGNMQSPNTTMKDPVLFRIVEEPHPIQKSKFRVWPTYDFDGAVEDSLDGVTHALRSKEYELRDELYHSLLSSLGLRQPEIIEFSRLSLADTTVSKRSLRNLIESGKVSGWDDPRLPTISGLERRGFLPEAIRRFILSMGVSKVESEPTWHLLEAINRQILDPIAKRFFFVPDPVELDIEGFPKLEVHLRNHPGNEELGERTVTTCGRFLIPADDVRGLHTGDKIRLIEAYTVEVIEVKDKLVLGVRFDSEQEGTFAKRVQWVDRDSAIPFHLKVIGPLLKEGEFNPDSIRIREGLAEDSVSKLATGKIIQFTRVGFCRIDAPGVGILTHK
jgi:glutamyl-tRNA synthetase